MRIDTRPAALKSSRAAAEPMRLANLAKRGRSRSRQRFWFFGTGRSAIQNGSETFSETAMSWFSYSSLIPPSLFILLTIIGLALAWRWTRLGLVVATFGGTLLYFVSMPVVAD